MRGWNLDTHGGEPNIDLREAQISAVLQLLGLKTANTSLIQYFNQGRRSGRSIVVHNAWMWDRYLSYAYAHGPDLMEAELAAWGWPDELVKRLGRGEW